MIKFIGNTKNNSFHIEDCRFSPKDPSKRVVFRSMEEAVQKGFKPCSTCLLFIGNRKNKSFHRPDCKFAPKDPGKRVEFHFKEEAIAEGYTACSTCSP